ncbi:PIN domain-containing protein [Streptomyces sp. NPDC048410]|uniref:PIN domain-containing protein n=1 Tax=Streptomyces sp. NPDC048410 TaxID=3365545 RepID=UPI00371D98A2
MLVTPHPGADRGTVLDTLRSVHVALENLRGGHQSTAYAYLLSYLRWATDSSRLLRHQIHEADIGALILTHRYRALLDGAGHLAGTEQQGFVSGLVDLEVEERLEAFIKAIESLIVHSKRWDGVQRLVVADSSFYVHYPQKLADMDLCDATGTNPDIGVHLLVPLVVIDELDRLKEAGRPQPRWRARHTLAILDGVLDKEGRGVLRPADLADTTGLGAIRREVTVEVVFDPPGHVRLPNDDDEIVDRALAVQGVAGQPVKFLTYDTGQGTRARIAGLDLKKFRDGPDPEQEPDWKAEKAKQGNGTRARRRERQEALGDAAESAAGS